MDSTAKYLGKLNNPPENPNPGDWYEDNDGRTWVCNIDGTQWLEFTQDSEGNINTGLTNYDLNKMVINQLPSKTTNGQLKESKEVLKQLKTEYNNKYYMLLCNDIHYYTVLRIIDTDENCIEFYNLVIELLQDHGTIQLIEWMNINHDAIECWVKNENGTFMFLLFPYDWGVIECV